MKESDVEFIYDAKNVVGELAPTKIPDLKDKDAPKLKRLAPRRPEQEPDEQPKKAGSDEWLTLSQARLPGSRCA